MIKLGWWWWKSRNGGRRRQWLCSEHSIQRVCVLSSIDSWNSSSNFCQLLALVQWISGRWQRASWRSRVRRAWHVRAEKALLSSYIFVIVHNIFYVVSSQRMWLSYALRIVSQRSPAVITKVLWHVEVLASAKLKFKLMIFQCGLEVGITELAEDNR